MRALLRLIVLLAIAWVGGLVLFIARLPEAVEQPEQHTDAIVVPTGGSERLQEGIRLLIHGAAGKLFVSGVNVDTKTADLVTSLPADAEKPQASLVDCCIVIGHAADSTMGNAAETAAWMKAQGFHSLRLVTADYHMPRSLLEFRRAMPGAEILINPVFPDQVHRESWWRSPGTASLLIGEYNKYLLALARSLIASLLGPNGAGH
ncbi:MAG TPA: YdcF family protein [Candidatus Polarisedimenticolia bacterium]|jgi:uncharacterized SAM-binding protein YcdF (DUF218 family)|nr:YdcF family protein [Dongiaceae bacterium]HYV89761.1 YdcF family protein [Candidatus Polarisedimenticolia bacterium]